MLLPTVLQLLELALHEGIYHPQGSQKDITLAIRNCHMRETNFP